MLSMKKALRFGIRDLLWAMALLAVLLGWWLEQPSRRQWLAGWFQTPGHTKVYYVGDIAPLRSGQPFAAQLQRDLRQEVTPDAWGAAATIASFETNESLVISHTEAGHSQIERFLARRRGEIKSQR